MPDDAIPTRPPLATLTLFGYERGERAWAFARMGLARPQISRARGLRFWRLVGSGDGGGFSTRPDWSRYGLFAVWESPEAADEFFGDSDAISAYRAHAREIWTVRLSPARARGAWGGANPLLPLDESRPALDEREFPRGESRLPPGEDANADSRPIAVLTRASIRLRRLRAFWSAVPAASRAVEAADGLIRSIGIGEAPFVRQATFSLWRDARAMEQYAYGSIDHREAMRRTRAENWYAEELFARFAVVASEGTWDGRDPLGGLL